MNALYSGKLVRLAIIDPEVYAAESNRWFRNSAYLRFGDAEPAAQYSLEQQKEWLKENLKNHYFFGIWTLDENKCIGDVVLDEINPVTGEAWLGIGIGEVDFWGKGYGTDAMRLMVRYGFLELNLNRITLDVFEYNPRAIQCYLKAGFKEEGRERQWLYRAGKRWDLVYMGILKDEWFAAHQDEVEQFQKGMHLGK